MTALLGLADGSFVPLAGVGRVEPPSRDGHRIVRDPEDRVIGKIGEYAFNDARTAGLPIIHAAPGWLLFTYAGPDEAEFWHDSEPVVGFVADGGWLVPITPSWGVGWNLTSFFILAPALSGATMRAFAADETSYSDESTALEAVERTWREGRQRRTRDGAADSAP